VTKVGCFLLRFVISHAVILVSFSNAIKKILVGEIAMNLDLKLALIRNFGSQVVASRRLKIQESRLSYLVRGYSQPNEREREILRKALGADYFSKEEDGPQAA
jgi:hypothetical protein